MSTSCRVLFPALLGYVLILGPSVARVADEPQAKGDAPALTAEQKAKLKERDALDREAEQLRGQGKYREAIERAGRALQLTRQLRGAEHAGVAPVLADVAELQELEGDFSAAVKSRKEAQALWQKLHGEKHWRTGEARRALSFAEKAAALKEEQRARLVGALRKEQQALQLEVRRKHIEAERVMLEVLEVFGEVQGPSTAETARIWAMLGRVRLARKAWPEAKLANERAVEIRRAVMEKDNPNIAMSLCDLGRAQYQLQDYAAARQSFEQSLIIYRQFLPKNHVHIANILTYLGSAQWYLADRTAARKSYEEALPIYRQTLPENDPNVVGCLRNLLDVQVALRDYAAARKSLEESLAIRRRTLPKEDPQIANSLNNLGTVQFLLLDYAAAQKSFEEALAICRKARPRDHAGIAQSLNNLGNMQKVLRNYVAARKSFEEALIIRRQTLPKYDPKIALVLCSLGNVQSDLGDYTAARQSYEESLAIYRQSLPKDHPNTALVLSNLGNAQKDLGDYAAARQSYEESLAMRRKALPKDDPQIADSLNNLGAVQFCLRDYTAAQKRCEEALATYRAASPKDHPRLASCLENLGILSFYSGAGLQQATLALAEATDLLHTEQLRLAIAQAEQEQITTAAATSACLHRLLSASLATDAPPDQLYARVVHVKGSVTTQQRWARQLRDSKDPDTVRLLRQLRDITLQLTGLSVSDRASGPSDRGPEVGDRIQELSAERAKLERQLGARSDVYRALQGHARLGADDIRAALGHTDDVALLDFVDYLHRSAPAQGRHELSYQQRLVAFVIRPGQKSVTVVPLGSTQLLAQRIDRWRASHGAGKAPLDGTTDTAAELRKHLWEPLEKHLKGVKVVLVSPDGPLHGLPFAALPGTKPGTFLIRDYAFAVVPIPQLLPQLQRSAPQLGKAQPSLLLAGGIDFGQSKTLDIEARTGKLPPPPVFKPLRGTESEVNDLRAQFEDAFPDAQAPRVLRKDKATKQAVLAAAPSHRFVHLATHGFFAAESEKSALAVAQRATLLRDGLRLHVEATGRHPGLLSGVVFAGVNRPDRRPEEAILTALEASELELGKVELVILSACDTGRGQVAGGEGVLGLQRAFQLAGARSVVASLWSVPDEETHQLMREFYRRVWSDKPLAKAEALRQAQLWMLDNWKPRGGLERLGPKGPPPPYVWAAFVLSGDWR